VVFRTYVLRTSFFLLAVTVAGPGVTPRRVDGGVGLGGPAAVATSRAAMPAEGLIGVVYPHRALDLHAEISGRVDTVAIELGQRVTRGGMLVLLDRSSVESELRVAKADEDVAAADLKLAELERELAEKRMESRQKSAEAWSREELEDYNHQFGITCAKAAKAQAQLERQRAIVATLNERLAKAKIVAPFSGTIARRYVEPGTQVESGDPVVRLISDRNLRVRFGVPEATAGALVPGMVLDAEFPEVGFHAEITLTRIAREIDSVTGLAIAEAALGGSEGQRARILSGMKVRVHAPPLASRGVTKSPASRR
jgi:RND family efflux transporter MFP subunit